MPPVFRKNRLAFYRLVRGIEQREIARYVGVTPGTISNWENDVCLPSKDRAERVATLLKIPVHKLWPFESL